MRNKYKTTLQLRDETSKALMSINKPVIKTLTGFIHIDIKDEADPTEFYLNKDLLSFIKIEEIHEPA